MKLERILGGLDMSFSDCYYIKAEEFCVKVTDGTHDSPKRKTEGKFLIT